MNTKTVIAGVATLCLTSLLATSVPDSKIERPKTFISLSAKDLVKKGIKEEEKRKKRAKEAEEHLARIQREKEEAERKERERLAMIEKEKREEERKREIASRAKETRGELFTITAYDLSVRSCGKPVGSKGYGVTKSSFNLSGHTWQSAKTVAADPRIYPMGTQLRLTFVGEGYQKYNGVYTVRDTGGAIKGNTLDFFMGDFHSNETHQSVWDFGRAKAYVEVVN